MGLAAATIDLRNIETYFWAAALGSLRANEEKLVPQTVVLKDMDEHVATFFAATLNLLWDAGAHIVEIDVPEFAQLATINTKGGLIAAEA